jgi:hypothetical protein
MKVTVEIPDELYRKVKAKSALKGRRVREVAAELFRGWVGEAEPKPARTKSTRTGGTPAPPWFGSLRQYAKNAKGRHDMESIRASIARGRAAEWAEKEKLP